MPHWIVGQDAEPELLELYEAHYSCYRYRDGRKRIKFAGPGETVILTLPKREALFIWRKHIDDTQPPQQGVSCAVFRNTSSILSSDLIREADAIADFGWPSQRHYTLVRAEAIASRNPGWCFICAGWKRCGTAKGGLVILERL